MSRLHLNFSEVRLGLLDSAIQFQTLILTSFIFHTITSFGVSKNTYSHSRHYPIHGGGQGTGWAAKLRKANQDVSICSIDSYPGIYISSPWNTFQTSFRTSVVIDDATIFVSIPSDRLSAVPVALSRLQQTGQADKRFLHATGGRNQLHKTRFTIAHHHRHGTTYK